MQQKLAQKEKESKEENLRLLAQRAREERGGIAPKPTAQSQAALKSSLAAYPLSRCFFYIALLNNLLLNYVYDSECMNERPPPSSHQYPDDNEQL
jgi:hypothetical protein